jgi:hypothetical protein
MSSRLQLGLGTGRRSLKGSPAGDEVRGLLGNGTANRASALTHKAWGVDSRCVLRVGERECGCFCDTQGGSGLGLKRGV